MKKRLMIRVLVAGRLHDVVSGSRARRFAGAGSREAEERRRYRAPRQSPALQFHVSVYARQAARPRSGSRRARRRRLDDDNTTLIFVPFGGKFYIIPKDGSLYLAAGGVFLNASTDSGPFDESGSTSYGYLGLGFEYRSESGLLFRGSAYGLIAGGSFFIWPGLSVGYAF